MKIKKKYRILIVLAIGMAFLFCLGYYIKNKITHLIEDEVSQVLKFESIDVNVFSRGISVKSPRLESRNILLSAKGLYVDGLGYFNYLFWDEIDIGSITLKNPNLVVLNNNGEPQDSVGTASGSNKFGNNIIIDKVKATNGTVTIKEKDTTQDFFFMAFHEFNLNSVSIDSASSKQKIPLNYESYSLEGDSLHLQLGELHRLVSENIRVTEGGFSMENTKIIPKYGKIEFQRHIPYEKDRYELDIDFIELSKFNWFFKNDTLHLETPLLTIKNANFKAYRNKLLPDDPRIKKMYSEQLRELPIKINFEEVQIANSSIGYEEKNHKNRPPLKVNFNAIDAKVENLTNMGLNCEDFPKTTVHVQAAFLEEAPLKVNWGFNINNLQERFQISGQLGTLNAASLNPVLKPAINIKTEGQIVSLAFNYAGNQNVARGDARIEYQDFRIIVLREDGRKKNKFLSAIVNLFVENEAVSKNVVHQDLEVQRDKKKSFWNYFWLMIRKGALKAFL